jgi:peptide/nickel transport system substrate-binding protein
VDLTIDRGISTDQAYEFSQNWTEGRVLTAPDNGICMHPQYMNPTPAVLSDLRFRKGLMYAVNRQEMVDVLQHGLANVAELPLEPSHPLYNQILAQVARYPYDPRQAAQQFQEAGYTRGPDGMLRDAAGQTMGPRDIRAGVTLDIQMKSMASVANYWRQAGLEITESPISAAVQGDRPYRVSYPSFELGRHCNPGERYLTSLDISSRVPTPANGYSSGNYPNYSNPQWDALQARFVTAIPSAERVQALTDVCVFMMDQLFEMLLYNDTGSIAVSNRVAYGGTIPNQGWDAYTWDLK